MLASWRRSLAHLQGAGWDADEIDAACETLAEACLQGELDDFELDELTQSQVTLALGVTIDRRTALALAAVAWTRLQRGSEAGDLSAALYDLDAFADSTDREGDGGVE